MNILVVDDDIHFCEFMQLTLGELAKCNVICAHDGHEAERLLAEKDFDLVYLDLKMPGKNGNEVLKTIRARHATLPVLILSGIAKASDQAHTDHFTRFAEKPQDMAALRALLRDQLDSL